MAATRPRQTGVADELADLEATIEQLSASLETGPHGSIEAEAIRVRSLRDALASHALAARVLVDAGAPDGAIVALLHRVDALLAPGRRAATSP